MSTRTEHSTVRRTGTRRPEGPSRLEEFIDAMIDLGQTGQIFGEHGIGKTATFFSHIAEAHPGTALVYVPAANLTPDDLLVNAPVRDPATGELVLRQLVMSQLKPGRPFVLLIDDSLQAGDTIQSQLMQVACNWTLGEHDLRELGCVGVFLTDNESQAETSARRGDLALLDRMVTMRITANDTSWRRHLAAEYRPWDLTEVFALWASLPATLRQLLSPRTLDHVLANAREGFPLRWGLPIVDGERLRLAEPGPDGRPGTNRTTEILDRIARAVGAPNPPRIADPVRQVVRAALRNRWTVLLQGPPGCGKTELVRETLRQGLGREPLYFSLPVTNVEDLCAPVPSPDGTLDNLLAAKFTGPEPKAIVWDEYNRPKDKAAFAKLMEITQEWSLAGRAHREPARADSRAEPAVPSGPQAAGVAEQHRAGLAVHRVAGGGAGGHPGQRVADRPVRRRRRDGAGVVEARHRRGGPRLDHQAHPGADDQAAPAGPAAGDGDGLPGRRRVRARTADRARRPAAGQTGDRAAGTGA
ncbi:hypothetical protein GCM10020256_07830 [Streptomyces thermocoprophilus]